MARDVSPTDHLPAQNIEAEQGTLGSMILDNSLIHSVRAALAGPDDFFRDTHQLLYQCILHLADRGVPVDAITLIEELQRREWLEDVGNEDYVVEIINGVPHAANGLYYAQIVRQKAVARLLTEGAEEVIRRAASNELTAEQLVEIARARVDEAEASTPTWDEPDLAGLPLAVPFPTQIFPEGLARLVREAAETFPCPADFVAIPCLASASVAIGRSVAIAIKESWIESASLYMAFCAPPGSIKSEALKLAVRPMFELQRTELFHYLVEKEVVRERERLRKASGSGSPEEKAPPLRRLLVDDTTTERLAELLAENPRGLLMAADELSGWIAGMNQYKSGGNDRQFYLKIWSGSAITRDRKSQEDGVPIIVPHPYLTICGAITPDKLPSLTGDGSDDGFLDRILFGYPDPVRVRFMSKPLSEEAQNDWSDALERLFHRAMTPDDKGGFRPYLVRFTDRALVEFGEWFDRHCDETLDRDFPLHLRGPWAKMRGYCARFALVLDSLFWAYDPTGCEIPSLVGVESVRRAITLVDYFKSHARRCYHAIRGETSGNDDALAILEWARRRPTRRFSTKEARDCFRRRFVSSPSGLADALGWLEGRSVIRKLAAPPRSKAGRAPSDTYELHPSLRKSAREMRDRGQGETSQ